MGRCSAPSILLAVLSCECLTDVLLNDIYEVSALIVLGSVPPRNGSEQRTLFGITQEGHTGIGEGLGSFRVSECVPSRKAIPSTPSAGRR